MTTLQIVLLSVAGAFAFISLIFMIMFIAEISVRKKEKRSDEIEVKSIFSSENYVSSVREEPKLDSISSMLAKLDEQAAVAAKVEPVKIEEIAKVVVQEEVVEPIVEEIAESPIEVIEETKLEDSKAEETIQIVEEVVETTEENVEEVEEEPTEESVEVAEPVDETTEEVAEEAEEVEEESIEETQEESTAEVDGVKVEEISGETISIESLPDYQSRLDKIIENRDKLNKDLIKIEKSILNYERTKRRKLRNQKMLDRRASELTNLNLIMYSVTDIKNVDEEKKIKQEELTSHIAELKASIQDAEEFLDSNKEKNEHDVKMAKFLIQEKARFNEEIVELQKLIATIDGASE